MIDEGYVSHANGPPIKLTKERPAKPPIPRDDFKVKLPNMLQPVSNHCMRYVEYNGKSYAITYWNCPKLPDYSEANTFIYLCNECKMVTWIEVDV